MNQIRLVLTFYRSYVILSSTITLACASIIYTGGLSTIVAIFWFKVIMLGITIYVINDTKKNTFFYYKNLGLSKRRLWCFSILIDMVLFLGVIILTAKLL